MPSPSAFDFEGLEESLVDNNEEDDDNDDFQEHGGGVLDASIPMRITDSSGIMFDHNLIRIRDALIRDSSTRTEEDFEIIVRFLSIINSNHDHLTRRRLAPHFVLAEIEAKDTRVLTHAEKLDAYCIVAAGSLRQVFPCEEDVINHEAVGSSVDDESGERTLRSSSCSTTHHHHHQNVRYLQVGDEFGAHLDDRVVYGEIFTNDDFVWVLCVPHLIFDQIYGENTFRTIRDMTGRIIEMRANSYIPLPPGSVPPPGNASQPEELSGNEYEIALSQVPNGYGIENNYSSHSQPDNSQSQIIAPTNASTSSSIPNSNQTGSVNTIPPPALNKQTSLIANDSNELIRATKERLYELVFAQKSSEIFIEDFLLTFRIWSENELKASRDVVIMRDLMHRICSNIRSNQYVENCVRIVLIWMANHFQDFQNDNRFLLEDFENILKERSLTDHLRLFHLNLSAKSTERLVTVKRSDRNTTLPFSFIGGYESSARLFIGEIPNQQMVPSSANSSSSLNNSTTSLSTNNSMSNSQNMHNLGLRVGDRVLSINGIDCHVMPINKAYDQCLKTTHLSLLVKYDPHLYNAFIEGRCETKRQIVETYSRNNRSSTGNIQSGSAQVSGQNSVGITPTKESSKKDGHSSGNLWGKKVLSLMSTTKELISNSTSNILHNNSHHSGNGSSSGQQVLNNGQVLMPGSSSSSSLSSGSMNNAPNGSVSSGSGSTHPRVCSYEVPEIIKIYYYENNDFRFLPINSATTARECIQLSLIEFNLSSSYSSTDFCLSKYSVVLGTNNANGATEPENTVAERTQRVGDGSSDLVTQLGLNARFYLKLLNPSKESNSSATSESEKDKEIFKEIVKESSIVSLLNLNGSAIARELTARDFRLFCKIEAQQFVYDLAFNDPNSSKTSSSSDSEIIFERTKELQEFEKKTNEEMFWTINQVLSEKRSNKRVKVIRELINIANIAMKLNNFNTLFAILSGLTHLSVSRLKSCWDKVPNKVIKELEKLQMLMDPSRNFYNFRQKLMEILRQDNGAYIIIPFFPLVKKDLSFIWLANQTYINSADIKKQSSDNGPKVKGENLVNWEKMRLLSEKIREIQKMTNTTSLALAAVNELNQSTGVNISTPSAANEPIDPNLLFRIFADNMTGEDPRTFSNKRLWESQIMNKRVQSFLDESFVSVQSDEQKLLSRSYSCEIPHTPNANSATRNSIASTMSSSSQLSHPSPTPSTASSSSNSLSMNSDGPAGHLLHRPHRPKFGQTSPKQLRKLLALSDGAVAVHKENSRGDNLSNNMHSSSHHPPHSRNGHGNGHSHHHHPHLSSSASNSSNLSQSHSHNTSNAQQSSQNQYSHQPQHSFHSSNSSLNSSLSGSTSYYNNLYGCHPNSPGVNASTATSSSTVSHYHVSNINGSMTLPSNYMAPSGPHMSMSKLSRNYSQSNAPFNPSHFNDLCCPPSGNQSCCSSGPQNGVLYPGQSYCSCCPQPPATPTMRAPMMMMPPPQQSGLMHPSCPCGPSQSSRGQRHMACSQNHSQGGVHSLKQPLPVESSSVTSLRRLEQYQQNTITRYRHSEAREVRTFTSSKSHSSSRVPRPQCPDYDTAMQRICTGTSTITINGNSLNHNGGNKGSFMRPNPVPPIPPPPPPTNRSHHREDIV